MTNLNKVMLMGRLTRDPESKTLSSGTSITEFGIAINRKWNQNGEKREDVTYVEVAAWEKTGDTIAQYLKKGDPIFIEGRLNFSSWETKEGEKRSKLSVTCDRFQFIPTGEKKNGESGDNIKEGDFSSSAAGSKSNTDAMADVPF